MKNITDRCKTCKHWNNKQSELEYSKFVGICTCFKWKFQSTNTGDVMLLDRENKSTQHMAVRRFENQSSIVPVGVAEKSRYCFVTEEEFGCIHYQHERK